MPTGVAVLGLDHWYTAFAALDILHASTVAPLRGIADPDAARQAQMRAKYPDVSVVADADELLLREDIGLVAICATTDRAPGLSLRSLRAGKHVVCVKPAARTLAELDAVIAVANETGRFFGSFEGMQRLHPRATIARDLIGNGAIGTPLSFHQRGQGGLPAPWPGQSGDPRTGGDSWWLQPERVPGGAWIDHAIYAVDLARFALNSDGPVETVGSLIENRAVPAVPGLGVEDYGIALLRMKTGDGAPVSLVLEDTWTAAPGGGASRQEFLGTAGTLRLDGGAWVVTGGGAETRYDIPAAPFFPLPDGRRFFGRADTGVPCEMAAAASACCEFSSLAPAVTTKPPT